MKKIIGNETVYINPSTAELGTYQKHGLSVHDRKPNDYLRMVAKTFSVFRETDGEDTIAAYISGFEIDYQSSSIEKYTGDTSEESMQKYHIFTINKGTCIIDNQLINFSNKTVLYYPWEKFTQNTSEDRITYCIIIEYDYLNQYTKEVARFKIINKSALTFPDNNQKEKCFYVQGADNNETHHSGKPGLVIGEFAVDLTSQDFGAVVRTEKVDGVNVPGINPQELGKLYMNNYKSLFKHFGTEAMRVYSDMMLTNSNFLTVSNSSIDKELTSGHMCYFDPVECKYKKSKASHSKIDRVAGLYLKEKDTGNNVIFFNGLIQLQENKWQLELNSPLRNLVPGQEYFLEDRTRTLLEDDPILNIEGVTVADSSGRITPRSFPGAVSIGTALAENILLLNINKEQEITVTNIMEIVGKHDEFEIEYKAVKEKSKLQLQINDKLSKKNNLIAENSLINNIIGSPISVNINEIVPSNINSANAIEWYPEYKLIINAYARMFLGLKFKDQDNMNVYCLDLFEKTSSSNIFNNDTGAFQINRFKQLFNNDVLFDSDCTTEGFTFYNHSPNDINYDDFQIIKELLNGNYKTVNGIISILEAIINSCEVILNVNLPESYTDEAAASNAQLLRTSFKNYLQNKIIQARIEIGDNPDNDSDNFENEYLPNILANNAQDLTEELSEIEIIVNNTKSSIQQKLDRINNSIDKIELLKSYLDLAKALHMYLNAYKLLFSIDVNTNNDLISALDAEIKELEIQQGIATQNTPEGIPYALDIFLMDDHQRKVFNYTYLTDRLRKRLWQRDSIQKDLEKAILNGKLIEAESDGSNESLIAKLVQEKEIERLRLLKDNNDAVIIAHTEEYNKIRSDWGILPIALWDINFDDAGRTNQNIEAFRYGNDDHRYCYNGICSNSISPCSGLLMHFRRDSFSQGDFKADAQNVITIDKNSEIDNKNRELFILRHTDKFFGPDKLHVRFYQHDGFDDNLGSGILHPNQPGEIIIEDAFKVQEYIPPNQDGVSGIKEYNSDNLPHNYYFEKYSTDSHTAIANLTHDPAIKVSLTIDQELNPGTYEYYAVMHLDVDMIDADGNAGVVKEYLGKINYKIIVE